jgi:hypothetical protein
MIAMPSPEEVAELALTCARDALDRLIALIGSGEPRADGKAAPERALIERTRRDEDKQPRRSLLERFAALELLMAASDVLAPSGPDPDPQ